MQGAISQMQSEFSSFWVFPKGVEALGFPPAFLFYKELRHAPDLPKTKGASALMTKAEAPYFS